MSNEWRLVDDGPAAGAWNMAVDEAMLRGLAAGTNSPTLRFYGWQPACLSLGRFQKLTDAQWERLGLAPTLADIVRRPTGGRAVLHQHEVTYCAVLPESCLPPNSRSVLGAYRWLSEGLIEGLRSLGVQADLGPRSEGNAERESRSIVNRMDPERKRRAERGESATDPGFNCFEDAARCDFVVDGRKLIGAAQYRYRGCVLQHGSLLLKIDHDLWNSLELSGNAVSMQDLGIESGPAEIKAALSAGLSRRLGIGFHESGIAPREREMAHSLLNDKYGTERWNRLGKFSE